MSSHEADSKAPLPPDRDDGVPTQIAQPQSRTYRPLPVIPSPHKDGFSRPQPLDTVNTGYPSDTGEQERPPSFRENDELRDSLPSQSPLERMPVEPLAYPPSTLSTSSTSGPLGQAHISRSGSFANTRGTSHDQWGSATSHDYAHHYRGTSIMSSESEAFLEQTPLIPLRRLSYVPEMPYHPPAGPSRADTRPPDYPPEKMERFTFTLTAEMDALPANDRTPTGYTLSRERMAGLAEVDNALFSWFHFKVCLIAGIGFFVDAYDIFSINIASTMIAFVYTQGNHLQFPSAQNSAIKAAAPVGTFIGQIVFGWLADRIGRKRMYGIELIIIVIGTFGSALATSNDSIGTINIVAVLVVWRFIMGLGIGGDYPISAVMSSEFAATHIRGRMLTAVFSNQGWGQFVASIVGCLTVLAFKNSFNGLSDAGSSTDPRLFQDIDRTWRILVGLGCLPAVIGIYSRLTIPETPRFTMDIERNVKQAVNDIDRFLKEGQYHFDPNSVVVRVDAPRASLSDFLQYFSRWENRALLLGCAYSWAAIDVTFYGLGLNTDRFFNAIGFAPPNNSTHTCVPPNGITALADHPLGFNNAGEVFTYFLNLCTANMVLSAGGLIPGYWATFLLIDSERGGRKRIQLLGFSMLTVLFLVMGFTFPKLVGAQPTCADSLFGLSSGAKGFIVLFCIAGFFQNFGPNSTTFVVPSELFATRHRTTAHGICAASGKIGAIISQFVVTRINRPENILKVYVPFAFTGILSTLLLPETRSTTLEQNSHEDQTTFIRGPVVQEIRTDS